VLELFPGIGILGRGFEHEGFCVVRGPEKFLGGDVRDFRAITGRFDGVIAGSPCQDFSRARRSPPTGAGIAMLEQFARVVTEAQPDWFLLENVPGVPDVEIDGYSVQRFNLDARECGAQQRRLRRFQFGSRDGLIIVPARCSPMASGSQTCLATEGQKKQRRAWAEFCELQGLPRDFRLEGFTIAAKYRAVGNGVHLDVARTVARAIRDSMNAHAAGHVTQPRLCACQCGRALKGRQRAATPGCRKRLERARKQQRQTVTAQRPANQGESRNNL